MTEYSKVREHQREVPENKRVANTILNQLGGTRFIAMTGAKHFYSEPNGMGFQFPQHNGVNVMKVHLNGKDLYDVEFGRIRKFEYTTVKKINDVYFDQLQDVFTQETGLATHL